MFYNELLQSLINILIENHLLDLSHSKECSTTATVVEQVRNQVGKTV